MWKYLDEMNMNLLYRYAKVLSGQSKQLCALIKGETEQQADERKCKEGFYLIWFVYRYVLNCKTFEETLVYANEKTLKEYKLCNLFNQCYMYIGIDKEIVFRKCTDILPVLEIVYNRYLLFEQIDCVRRYASIKRIKQCEKIKTKYLRMLEIYRQRERANEEDD